MRTVHVLAHALRVSSAALALYVLPAAWLAPGVALFLAAFTLAHDLAHGALGLTRRTNRVLLSLAGALMLTSGHAMRVAHLRHHARPLADDDYEGASARGSLGRALLLAPWFAFAVRREAWRRAPR